MGRKTRPKIEYGSEFELDLAPLLAVMVKLVPVLLVSSAFVQVMMIETDLPQVVQAAIEEQTNPNNDEVIAKIELMPLKTRVLEVKITKGKDEKTVQVPAKDGAFDLKAIHAKLVEVKAMNPKVFRVDFRPDGEVSYRELVKVMDEARKARDVKTVFPVFDSKQGKDVTTDYMFPEIIFANTMEG